MDNLFTWETLATLAGASGVTYLVVAYTKKIVDQVKVFKFIGTDLYAVIIGFLVLLGATAANGAPLNWSNVVLAFLNGFLVAATSGKMNDKAGN